MSNITLNEAIIKESHAASDGAVLAWDKDKIAWIKRPEGISNFLATKDDDKFILKNPVAQEYGELYLGQPYTPYECGSRITSYQGMPKKELIAVPLGTGSYVYGVTNIIGRELGWMRIDEAMMSNEQ